MTKQEWIIKNDKPGVYIGAYREGLEKGLEIAEGFLLWYRYTDNTIRSKSPRELLEIYLNEINEKK